MKTMTFTLDEASVRVLDTSFLIAVLASELWTANPRDFEDVPGLRVWA